jgi:hypothetical protein
MKSFFALVLGALLLSACSPSTVHTQKPHAAASEAQRSALVGRWYGETATKDGGKRLHIMERSADGTYRVNFRTIESSGKVSDQTEVGLWGVSGLVYFTITRGWLQDERFVPADPEEAYYYDAYKILELSKKQLRYRSCAVGDKFLVTRVADDFSFPD